MNRTQKIALLKQVFESANPEAGKTRLIQAVESQSRGLIIIDDLDNPGLPMSDDSAVRFHDKGIDHNMSLREAHRYAKRNFINTLFVLPTNGRD